MLKSNRVLALDVGASKVVLAEFGVSKTGAVELLRYGLGKLGVLPDGDSDTSAYIVSTIRDIMRTNGIKPAPMLMTVSGQAVFPRFVKLPPVSRDKILQIVQYEAEQNVPFPIEEVVWDYQLVGDSEDETNVILVAVKTENIRQLTDCVLAAGLDPEIVDVAPMALYNAVRYNYPDLVGCTMVLDIGARSSNLIFIEESRIFSRSIPVAGNTITQEIAKEFDVSFEEAERMKIEHAVVGLGGVYAGPDNEDADRISKIVRNVITRLHAEVNRSVNFYRSQQGGNAPSHVLLTGGSSTIPHTDTFFREKLKADVDYLNPFASVPVSPGIAVEDIQRDLHVLGEIVGLGLRRALTCPVEINLMPPELVAKKEFRRRQPFFALSAMGVALVLLCWWVYTKRMTNYVFKPRIEIVESRIRGLRTIAASLDAEVGRKRAVLARVDTIVDVVSSRTQWLEVLAALHRCMLEGMWITGVKPVLDSNGSRVKSLKVEGKGFVDKLREADRRDTTSIEVFRDNLRGSGYFGAATKIDAEPPPPPGAYLREFKMDVVLAEPIIVK